MPDEASPAAPSSDARPSSVIGDRLKRPEGAAHASGQTRYAADLRLPGLLHAVVAPHRGAHLQGLDTDQLGHPREGRRVTA